MIAFLIVCGIVAAILALVFGQPRKQERYTCYPSGSSGRFVFDLVKLGSGEVRIYIVEQPFYGARPTDGHSTHRYHDTQRGHYLCVDTCLRPTNFDDAKSWASYWADQTARYIATGQTFS